MALSSYDIKRILHPKRYDYPIDDFRMIDSWAEYEENTKYDVNKRPLKFLCYQLEVIDPETGEKIQYYKAIKFLRVIRLPKAAKQSTSLMDIQSQVLAGVYQEGINLITVIANVIEPESIGLLYLYGTQGIASTIDEAKKIAQKDYIGFAYSMQASFRVLEMRCMNAEETEWLREKMYNMDYLTVVRGIPKASESGEDAGNKGIGGRNINPDSHGTLEELITGMADYEYVLQILATPVYKKTLEEWSLRTQQEMTDWYEQLQGTKSFSFNLSMPMMISNNQSSSEGWNKAYTDADSVSYSQGESFGTSYGENVGTSFSENYGQSFGRSIGQTVTDSVSQSHSISQGQSMGHSVGRSFGNSQGMTLGETTGATTGLTQGQSINHSDSFGTSHGESINHGQSYNVSQGTNSSISHSIGKNQSVSVTESETAGVTNSATIGHTATTSQGQSFGTGISDSMSNGTSFSQNHTSGLSNTSSNSYSINESSSSGSSSTEGSSTSGSVTPFGLGVSTSGNSSETTSNTNSSGSSASISNGASISNSNSIGYSNSQSVGHSISNNASVSSSNSLSNSVSNSESLSHTSGISIGNSQGVSETWGESTGMSLSEGWGINQSLGESYSVSQNTSDGWGQSASLSNSLSNSNSQSINASANQSQNMSQSLSQNVSESYGISQGRSVGNSYSESVSESVSQGIGQSYGKSQGISQSQNYTNGTSSSQSQSVGSSGAYVMGSASSMGVGPSIGYNKSYQWLDQQVKDILELLEYQNERLKKSLRGMGGAFYTYVYFACSTPDSLMAAKTVSKAAWQNNDAMMYPTQVLNLSEEEQHHLLYHFTAFSSDVTRENVYGVRDYKYGTALLPEELVAYTHLPRISEGGVFASVDDIPKFAVPSQMKGEIYMGTILSPERYTMQNGYRTPYDYRLDEAELMHGFFTGASRSGKTVAAMRFVCELSRIRRKKTGKRLRIVAMDPKQDWRTLARFVEPERFHFYNMGRADFRPIKINPLKIPRGVRPQFWIDGVIDIYCRAYGLLERGKQMMGETIYSLYEDAGVFEAEQAPDWKERVPELSKEVTFAKVYERMTQIKARLEDPTNPKGRAGNDTRDAYARLLDRLQAFGRPYSIEHKLFGTSEGIGIDELIGNDDVTVLESKGLENTFRNFIFGVITSGFYKFALAHEGGYLSEDQYETVLIIEEANEVLTGNDAAGTGGGQQFGMTGQSEFEQILDQAAGYGLYIFAITQKIADMPKSIIANSGLVFAGRLKTPDDITTVVRAIGREDKFDDRDLVKWFPRQPTGWFVCQSSRTFDFKDAEPVLVSIARLNINPPSNAEIDEILIKRDAMERLAKAGEAS